MRGFLCGLWVSLCMFVSCRLLLGSIVPAAGFPHKMTNSTRSNWIYYVMLASQKIGHWKTSPLPGPLLRKCAVKHAVDAWFCPLRPPHSPSKHGMYNKASVFTGSYNSAFLWVFWRSIGFFFFFLNDGTFKIEQKNFIADTEFYCFLPDVRKGTRVSWRRNLLFTRWI